MACAPAPTNAVVLKLAQQLYLHDHATISLKTMIISWRELALAGRYLRLGKSHNSQLGYIIVRLARKSGRGAGVARTFGVGEAGGSNPLVPTNGIRSIPDT